MKIYRIIFPFFCAAILMTSCGDDDPVVLNMMDFRDEYVGTYDCVKGSTTIELVVSKDPDNDQNVLIGPYSIAIDSDGDFGPETIDGSTVIDLKMDGTNIFFSEHKPIPNGIVAPCVMEGTKR